MKSYQLGIWLFKQKVGKYRDDKRRTTVLFVSHSIEQIKIYVTDNWRKWLDNKRWKF